MTRKKQEQDDPAAVWMAPDELVPWDRNPRHNEAAIPGVMESIKDYGFGAPVVARKEDHQIIAGHTRVEAAKRLGLERVPVRLLDISAEDAARLALADNKLGELAAWDIDGLNSFIDDGLDLTTLGWSENDLAGVGQHLFLIQDVKRATPALQAAEQW